MTTNEIERALYHAEDFLRRNVLRPKSARVARKRRAKRRFEAMLRRVRRAGYLLAFMLAALVLASILTDIGLLTWLFALPTILLIAFLSLFWSAGRRDAPIRGRAAQGVPLQEMAARVEEGLIDRCAELPSRALPAADAIIARLGELQPHLASLEPNSLSAGEARRLICEHLPRLVDAYLAIPPNARGPASESNRRFTESLNLVAEELDQLLETCCRDRQASFDTEHRFLEIRYREHRTLKGE